VVRRNHSFSDKEIIRIGAREGTLKTETGKRESEAVKMKSEKM
jgi:hypothetical protein